MGKGYVAYPVHPPPSSRSYLIPIRNSPIAPLTRPPPLRPAIKKLDVSPKHPFDSCGCVNHLRGGKGNVKTFIIRKGVEVNRRRDRYKKRRKLLVALSLRVCRSAARDWLQWRPNVNRSPASVIMNCTNGSE